MRVWDEYRSIDIFCWPTGIYWVEWFGRNGRVNLYSDTLEGIHALIDFMEVDTSITNR